MKKLQNTKYKLQITMTKTIPQLSERLQELVWDLKENNYVGK
jgi:hypothetical protein